MQKNLALFTAVAAALLGATAPRTHAALSVDFFYENLDPYGDWVEVGDYGYCFQPRDTPEDWRPYNDGSWAYTDAGWTWVSDEPHGWATYHYGRWLDVENTGWVWVPDTEWAPAWVSWRNSDKYVGWAPLPPEATFTASVGISDWADSYYDIGPTNYSFVQVRDLGAPRLNTVIVRRQENVTIINETRNITNITYVNNTVVNNGPQYDVVSRQSAQPIRRLRLERRAEADANANERDRYATRVSGDSLQIMAPPMQAGGGASAPKRLRAKVANVQVDRGWKNAGTPEQVQALQTKVKSEAKVPQGLPPQPKFQRAAARRADAAQTAATEPAADPSPAAKPEMKEPAVAATPDETPAPAATPDAAPQPGNKKARRNAAATTDADAGPNAGPGKRRPGAGKPRQGEPATPDASAAPTPDTAPGEATAPDASTEPAAGPGNRRPGRPKVGKPGQGQPATPDTSAAPTPGAAPGEPAAPDVSPEPGAKPGNRRPGGPGHGKARQGQPATPDTSAVPAPGADSAPGGGDAKPRARAAGPGAGPGGVRHNADSGAPKPNRVKPEGAPKGAKGKKGQEKDEE